MASVPRDGPVFKKGQKAGDAKVSVKPIQFVPAVIPHALAKQARGDTDAKGRQFIVALWGVMVSTHDDGHGLVEEAGQAGGGLE